MRGNSYLEARKIQRLKVVLPLLPRVVQLQWWRSSPIFQKLLLSTLRNWLPQSRLLLSQQPHADLRFQCWEPNSWLGCLEVNFREHFEFTRIGFQSINGQLKVFFFDEHDCGPIMNWLNKIFDSRPIILRILKDDFAMAFVDSLASSSSNYLIDSKRMAPWASIFVISDLIIPSALILLKIIRVLTLIYDQQKSSRCINTGVLKISAQSLA